MANISVRIAIPVVESTRVHALRIGIGSERVEAKPLAADMDPIEMTVGEVKVEIEQLITFNVP